jgi:hypothetical protein
MALTFADALEQLGEADAFPVEADTAKRKSILNETLERLITGGKFLGTRQTLAITVDDTGILTLPRGFSTILGDTVDGLAEPLTNEWFTFLAGVSTDNQTGESNVRDLGIGYPTISDPVSACTIKIACADSDPGVARVQGTDENGQTIFDTGGAPGIEIEINDADWTTQQFSAITAVELPVTDGVKTLTVQYVSDSTTAVLGRYEPGETLPEYRRYYVPDADNAADGETTAVRALCQREFVRLVSDGDIVFISHLGALKHGCIGINYLTAGEEERYNFHFGEAVRLLNSQLRLSRAPSEIGVIRVNCVTGMGTGLISRP